MTPIQTSDAHCYVGILPRQNALPDAPLLETLSRAARDRADSFQNFQRRCDFLWSRLVLTGLLERYAPGARLSERPPLSPLVVQCPAGPLFCTISHTRTWLGAALCPVPVAMDLEVVTPRRPVEQLFGRLFGAALWQQLPPEERLERFYAYWGQHECAVKLPGSLQVTAQSVSVINPDGSAAHCLHKNLSGQTLLTLITARACCVQLEQWAPDSLCPANLTGTL